MRRSASCLGHPAIRWLFVATVSVLLAMPAWASRQAFLLVSNREGENILRYELATGAYVGVAVAKGAGGMSTPFGMTIGPDGFLYVAGWYTEHSAPDARVLKFDAWSGRYLGTFASLADMKAPADLSFGPDGNLYVSDGYNKVFRFDGSTGASMGTFASVDAPGNSFRGSAWGPDGNFYAAQIWGGVARFDGSTGALIDVLAVGRTRNPNFVAFGSDGLLYLSQYWSGDIDVYNPASGRFVKTLGHAAMSSPSGVVFDDEGNLYAAAYGSNAIVKFTGGAGSVFAQGRPLKGPIDMVITSAVPEPATWAVLLAGLAAVGGAARRRR